MVNKGVKYYKKVCNWLDSIVTKFDDDNANVDPLPNYMLCCLNGGIQNHIKDFSGIKKIALQIAMTNRCSIGHVLFSSSHFFSFIPVYGTQKFDNSIIQKELDGRSFFFCLFCLPREKIYFLFNTFDETPLVVFPPSNSLTEWLVSNPLYDYSPISAAIDSIPGLFIKLGFVTVEEEQTLVDYFLHHVSWESLARRDIAHFGRRFFYSEQKIGNINEDVKEIPQCFSFLYQRLRSLSGEDSFPLRENYLFDQLTVNKYTYANAGEGGRRISGIAHHVDAHTPFGDCILILTLAHHTVMEFKYPCSDAETLPASARDAQKRSLSHHSKKIIRLYLPQRSLVLMTGEARYLWTHGIMEKKIDFLSDSLPAFPRYDRYSMTFRKARLQEESEYYNYGLHRRLGRPGIHLRECCAYPLLCDGV